MTSMRDLKRAILKALDQSASGASSANLPRRQAHRHNLIGREYQAGELEHALDTTFNIEDRVRASLAFDELKRDGYIRTTFRDTMDPDGWFEITDSGHDFLARDLKDDIDLGLEAVLPHLVELRHGMWDAVERTSPDAPRQAANSARELLDQLLRHGTPPECKTRKERFRYLMRSRRSSSRVSDTDVDVLEANAALVEVEHNALVKNVHFPGSPTKKTFGQA
jgi:hypothetical protein